MVLNEAQRKYLRGLAHALKPVVMVGQHGLKETTLHEIDEALRVHELLKIKVSVGDRVERDALVAEIESQSKAFLIQRVGNMAVFFRRNNKKPKIDLKLARKV